MSKIEKLQIQGVRSFGNEPAAINIFSPLTLIVGYNGSGKTTIIECLKYATTGELPPNSKGGAFIHDPKLTGEKDQWAQVKMQFKATTGARMVVTRNLQLTVKKSSRQQKTMECNLLMSKNGEKASISSRVTELDAVVPQYLGVSKAILENVVFCHQDDSLWPMSEPSNLKKKFDEIFEAQRYTKAIENIKLLRKKQIADLSKYKIIEQHAKEDKDRADKAEKRSRQLSGEIELLRDETQELHRKTQQAAENAKEASEKAAKFTETIENLKRMKVQQQIWRDDVMQLSQGLEERPESDETLDLELESHAEILESYQDREQKIREECEALEKEISKMHHEQNQQRTNAGRYQAQTDTHREMVHHRQTLISQAAKQHSIRGYEANFDEATADEFLTRLSNSNIEQKAHIEKLRLDNENEIRRIQDNIDELKEKRSTIRQEKSQAESCIRANEAKVISLQTEVNQMLANDGTKLSIESCIDEAESDLAKSQQKLQKAQWEDRMQDANARVRLLEERISSLNIEMLESTTQSSTNAKLELLRKDMKERQCNLDATVKRHGKRLRDIIGKEVFPQSVEKDISLVHEQRVEHLDKAEQDRAVVEKELEQLDFKTASAKSQMTDKQRQILSNAKEVTQAVEASTPNEYLDVLAELQDNRDTRANDVKSFKVLKEWYGECISTAKGDSPACRLCRRAFENIRSADRFVKTLERHISSAALDELQNDLDNLERNLQVAREVRGNFDQWRQISEIEVPSIARDINSYQHERTLLVTKLEEHDQKVKNCKEAKLETEAATNTAALIARVKADIDHVSDSINQMLAGMLPGTAERTVEIIKIEIDDANQNLNQQRALLRSMQIDEKNDSARIPNLKIQLSNLKSELATISAELEKKGAHIQHINDLKNSTAQQMVILKEKGDDLETIEPEIRQEQIKLDEIRLEGQGRERKAKSKEMEIRSSLDSLTRVSQEIKTYINQGGSEKLNNCLQDIERYNFRTMEFESKLKEVTTELEQIRKTWTNRDRLKRVLTDNLNYRKRLRALHDFEARIEELEAQNAETNEERYRKDSRRWQNALSLATTERDGKRGAMKAKDDQLVQLLHEWNSEYKDATAKFKRAHIEVETTKAVAEDLGRYGGALDKAIMKYHTLKMEEINRIIEELWKRTYQGTDIDTILIRSDNETTKGNRSYNYRVCMVKQEAEMDMRGRCSAGQRVLASIIIRLALAECFGTNCGLIALDEPTTNLDKDNIRSLAESLHEIITARKAQSNFQLIVITHDEEFLRYMRCSDFCENYFRVQRNDRQKSEIWRNSIADVM